MKASPHYCGLAAAVTKFVVSVLPHGVTEAFAGCEVKLKLVIAHHIVTVIV